jgi:hypothetical protein
MIKHKHAIITNPTMRCSRWPIDLARVAVPMRLTLVQLGKVLLFGFVGLNVGVEKRVVVVDDLLVLCVLRGELAFEVLEQGATGNDARVHAGDQNEEKGCEGYDDVKGDGEDRGYMHPYFRSGEY